MIVIFAHYGGIDEIGVFVVPAVLAILALRWAERRAKRAAAEKEFSCVITPAKKNYDLLGVVDQAMVSRAGNSSPMCKKTRA